MDFTFWDAFWWYVGIRAICFVVKMLAALVYCIITGADITVNF